MLSLESLVDGHRVKTVIDTPYIVAVDPRDAETSVITLSTGERRLVFAAWDRLRQALTMLRNQTVSIIPGEETL